MSYTRDEDRVCKYLQEIAPEVGCGLDPIGFLIASHAALREDLKVLKATPPPAFPVTPEGMMFLLAWDDGQWKTISRPFPKPSPPLEQGEKLEVVIPFRTLAGEHFAEGEMLQIEGFTTEIPHNRTTTENNLRVKGKGRSSVWSNVEWALHMGGLKRVKEG